MKNKSLTTFYGVDDLKDRIDLVDYALMQGYKIDKDKTTSHWIKLLNESTGDKILYNSKNKLYKSLIDEREKGDILQFVVNRLNTTVSVDTTKEGFYKTLTHLNEYLGNKLYLNREKQNIIDYKNNFLEKKEKLSVLQKNELNQEPIKDYSFFTEHRSIDMATLQTPLFKDRLFNSYFRTENNHYITNFCFGKFSNNKLVGLEIRNKTLKSVSGNHNAVFITNTEGFKKIDGVFYAESGIDILSYFEIVQKNPHFDREKNYCFISFGGNLYEEKVQSVLNELDSLPITDETKFISITDNDAEGKRYDVMLTAALIDKYSTSLKMSLNQNFFNYTFFDKEKLDIKMIQEIINKQNDYIKSNYDLKERYGKYTILKIKEDSISIDIPKSISLEAAAYIGLLKALKTERFYIPHKAKGKDWNEDLQIIKGKFQQEKKKESLINPQKKAYAKRF